MIPKRAGFLIFPAMQAIDLAGPMDAFDAAMVADGKGRTSPGYELITIGLEAQAMPAESGLLLKPKLARSFGRVGFLRRRGDALHFGSKVPFGS